MSALEVVSPGAAGGHGYLNTCLTTAGEGGVLVAALADSARLAPLVACFAATLPGGDRRAIGSMWWQYYASQLLVPSIALLTRGVAIDPDGATRANIGESGLAHGFRVTLVTPSPASDAAWLRGFIETHCQPVVVALKQVTGVSRHVLWGDAVRRLHRLCGSGAGLDVDRIRRLVEMPTLAGLANPLHAATRGGRPVSCCLRDRLPGYATCPDCPVRQRREARASAAGYAPISVPTCAAADLASPSRS